MEESEEDFFRARVPGVFMKALPPSVKEKESFAAKKRRVLGEKSKPK